MQTVRMSFGKQKHRGTADETQLVLFSRHFGLLGAGKKEKKKIGAFDNISNGSFQAMTVRQTAQLHNPETAKQERSHRCSAVSTPVSATDRLKALAALLQLAQDAKQSERAF